MSEYEFKKVILSNDEAEVYGCEFKESDYLIEINQIATFYKFAGYVFENGSIDYKHFRDLNGKMCKAVRLKKEGE